MKMEKEMISVLVRLVVLAACAGVVLGAIYIPTQAQLEKYKEEQRQLALKAVMPPGTDHFDPVKSGEETLYYRALDADNNLVGFCFFHKQSGSQDMITLAGGIDTDYKLAGIKIVAHKETPGLGSKIAELEFTDQFKGVHTSELALSKKGGKIDAITGATISSQAVIDGLHAKIDEIKGMN
ncbi:MAG TPA: RnfABCDGE type electron transport complex subunit G [Candidatus Methanoperedenaceae archaeon]|nr:MAG: electron transporter RnfG [Methanosarcinales archaeon]HHI30097.1 RnfABCDGE type electron transport complex subunit G [Candidatus Methanoperedenaceae archaeon]